MKIKELEGKFIVFEGIDGAGTTTQIKDVADFLRNKGYKVHTTAEPSRGPIGAMIRNMLEGRIVSSYNQIPDPKTIALLFAADRCDHLENEVYPYLKKGYIVLSDRYVLSSFVYQGKFTKDSEWIEVINKYAPNPDITFFFSISGDVAFKRLKENRSFLDQYEKKENLVELAVAYEKAFEYFNKKMNIIKIDAALKPENVLKAIIDSF